MNHNTLLDTENIICFVVICLDVDEVRERKRETERMCRLVFCCIIDFYPYPNQPASLPDQGFCC